MNTSSTRDVSKRPTSLKLAAVQLVDVVSSVVTELDASGRRVQIVMERAPTVIADFDKLADVTTKLLKSALRSVPEDTPVEVEIAPHCLEHPRDPDAITNQPCSAAVSVAVRSRREGDPDTTADSMATPSSLSDADNIVRLHKGRLWVTTRPDQTTRGFCLHSGKAA